MKWIVNSDEIKKAEQYCINEIGIPSLVLMERAALAVANHIKERFSVKNKLCIVSGSGNNGADGVAVARILSESGYQVTQVVLGKPEKFSGEMKTQLSIMEKLGYSYETKIPDKEFDCFVDAIFGIGLKREITDEAILTAIDTINSQDAYTYSVDIPSGISTDDGTIMGKAVFADETITFSFEKIGLCLYPGKEYAGKISVEEIGVRMPFAGTHFGYEFWDGSQLLKRSGDGNKGTFGKVVVIAGNEEISGACLLCARAVFLCGAGMVKVLSSKNTVDVIKNRLPEAMTGVLQEDTIEEKIQSALNWADCVIIGPGIGTDETAYRKVKCVLGNLPKDKYLVMDADALNIVAGSGEIREMTKAVNNIIYTPHMMELSKMTGIPAKDLKADLDEIMSHICQKDNAIYVCKDSVTRVYCKEKPVFLNRFGNSGMATAGSGDVLAGIIGAFLARKGAKAYEATLFGVHLHSLLGDEAAEKSGKNSLMAGDLTEILPGLVNKMEELA